MVGSNLVSEGGDVAQTVLVWRELRDVTHKNLDDFDVSLAECNHYTRDVAVVLTMNVGAVCHQQLHHLHIATCPPHIIT